MKVSIGTTVLASGTASGQPARLVGGTGSKGVDTPQRIRSAKGIVYGRGNRSYVDIIEADYSYATAVLAQAGFQALRVAALSATGTLVYGDGAGATTLGPGECRSAEVVEWTGCGLTMRYEIVFVEA
jgi:hypothetical protein